MSEIDVAGMYDNLHKAALKSIRDNATKEYKKMQSGLPTYSTYRSSPECPSCKEYEHAVKILHDQIGELQSEKTENESQEISDLKEKVKNKSALIKKLKEKNNDSYYTLTPRSESLKDFGGVFCPIIFAVIPFALVMTHTMTLVYCLCAMLIACTFVCFRIEKKFSGEPG